MKTIKIGYSNFWGTVEPLDGEYFYRMFPWLRGEYNIRTDKHPDYVFYSVYGYITNKAPLACRILISCEGGGDHLAEGGKLAPNEYDAQFFNYGLTCWPNPSDNHLYLPPPLININLYNGGVENVLIKREKPVPVDMRMFCNFIYSNPYSQIRRQFKDRLSRYKQVMCPGPVDTNTKPIKFTGYNKESYLEKQRYQAWCKFSIAFENCYSPGYTTEKLSDPLIARSVPIYSGNPMVQHMFNADAFIDVDNFMSHEAAIEHIEEVDNDPNLYNAYLNAPPIKGRELLWNGERYLAFFRKIFG